MASQQTHVSLTPLDHLHKANYIKICYWIPLASEAKPKDVYEYLGQGLRQTFYKMPWLGGTVHLQDPDTTGFRPGQREIRYSAWEATGPVPHQLVYKELDTDLTYADWKEEGFPSDAFDDREVLDLPIEGDLEKGCDIFVAQANFVPGGLFLCMSTCHAAIDGTGMVIVMKAWADCCRSSYDPSVEQDAFPPETYDRSLLDNFWKEQGSPLPVDADDWTKGLVGLEGPPKKHDINEVSEKKAVHKTFYLPAEKLAILQKQCDDTIKAGTDKLSSSDVITALMWRGSVRARSKVAGAEPLSDESVLEGAINGRLDFSQSLHPAYLGNVTFYNQAKLPIADVLDPSVPLSRLAETVRVGASRSNSKSLNEAYGLLRSVPDYDLVQPRFRRMEGADMLISNLLVFPVDDISFGNTLFGNNGKAEALRCFLGHFNDHARCSLVLPKRPGGVEITMNLFEDEMESLEEDEEWNSYCLAL